MKFVAFASLLVIAALSFVLAGVPSASVADSHPSACATCGGAPKAECPPCDQAEMGHHRHDKWDERKYEYKCVRPSKKAGAMTDQFNGLGAEGWKLKQADSGFWCFARVKAD